MNGIAFSLDPRTWGFGWRSAMDEDAHGNAICAGRWLLIGPLALCWDYT